MGAGGDYAQHALHPWEQEGTLRNRTLSLLPYTHREAIPTIVPPSLHTGRLYPPLYTGIPTQGGYTHRCTPVSHTGRLYPPLYTCIHTSGRLYPPLYTLCTHLREAIPTVVHLGYTSGRLYTTVLHLGYTSGRLYTTVMHTRVYLRGVYASLGVYMPPCFPG